MNQPAKEPRLPLGDEAPVTSGSPRRRTSPVGIVLVVLVLLGLAGAGYWYLFLRGQGGEQAAMPEGGFAMAVEAHPVRVGVVTVQVQAVGSLMSNESVLVAAEIAGRVARIDAEEGAAVKAGAPIAALDSEIYQAELAQAEASLALSEQNYRRAKELMEQGAGTQRAFDEAVASLASDKASVALARARYEKTRIDAPFDGTLGLKNVSVGAYVNPGDTIINLEQIDPLKVDFRVPESALAVAQPGREIAITVDAMPGQSFTGSIYAVNPLVDQQGRSVVVRARIPNADGTLRPGLFARVAVIVERRENAVLVPERAIVPFGEDSYVFRVIDGKAALTKVTTGLRQEGEVEIVEGLGREDVVVSDGLLKIGDGAPVSVIPEPAS